MLLNTSQSTTPWTFSFSILMPSGPIITSKNLTSLIFYTHFSSFTNKLFFVIIFSAFIISLNKSFIIAWKVASKFVSPKSITISSKIPSDIENAAFHLSSSFILTLLYLYLKSIFMNTIFFPVLSIRSETSGNE